MGAQCRSQWPRLPLNKYARQAKNCLRYDLATQPGIFGRLVFPILRRRAETRDESGSLEWVRIENQVLTKTLASRPHGAAFAEWNRKLQNIGLWLKHRRAIAAVYQRHLSDHVVSGPLSPVVMAEGCFSSYPVLVDPEARPRIRRAMITAGFDTGLALYPNVHRHPRFSGAPGRSKNVEHLVAAMMYLPTHSGVSEDYAEQISCKLAALIAE